MMLHHPPQLSSLLCPRLIIIRSYEKMLHHLSHFVSIQILYLKFINYLFKKYFLFFPLKNMYIHYYLFFSIHYFLFNILYFSFISSHLYFIKLKATNECHLIEVIRYDVLKIRDLKFKPYFMGEKEIGLTLASLNN